MRPGGSDPVNAAGPKSRTVWLHGAGLSSETWQERADGSCLNLPGHGGTPRAAVPTVSGFADQILSSLPEGRFALVGHSLGAMVAMEIAARRPGDLRALVLAETVYSMRSRWIDRKGAGLAVRLTQWLGPAGVARLTGLGQSRSVKATLGSLTATMPPEALTDALSAAHSFDARAYLDRLTMPVLILVAEKNPRTHPQAKALTRRLPNARMLVLQGGHFLHIDAPKAFFGTVQAFVSANP